MKTLVASVLFFFSTITFAMSDDDVYITENDAGGEIILISDECPIAGSKGARISITTFEDTYVVGCWFFYKEMIHIIWLPENSDPVKSSYDPEIFILEKKL